MTAFLAAIALTSINAIVATFLILRALKKKRYRDFTGYLYQSMGIRAVIVLIIFTMLILFSEINVTIFSVTFIVSYFLSILIEIIVLNNYLKRKQGK